MTGFHYPSTRAVNSGSGNRALVLPLVVPMHYEGLNTPHHSCFLCQSKPDKLKQGICYNFIRGLDIQILFSNVGELSNPQARIVGAKYNFIYADSITFQVCSYTSYVRSFHGLVWRGGIVVRASDLEPISRRFEFRLHRFTNDLRWVVHTHVPLFTFTKQYKLVPAKGRCSMAGKVTVGLASHWKCVTDSVVYPCPA